MQITPAAQPGSMFYPASEHGSAFIGLPRLMELAFRGADLRPVRDRLVRQVQCNPDDAPALMDLSFIMSIGGQSVLALQLQSEALSISRRYTLPATGTERLRVLSLMKQGSVMENMPLEFLLHGSDVTLDMLYLQPEQASLGLDLPAHDVACVGVCESPTARPLLEALARRMPSLPQATLNDPVRVMLLARDSVWRVLQGTPGCLVPPSVVVDREALQQAARGAVDPAQLLPGAALPLICRPQESHAGHGLERIDGVAALAGYLAANEGGHFVLSNFVDYRSPDGQFRKYRIAFVGGRVFPVHMALSARWMVHYLNGDMTDSAENRAEEQRFFDRFDLDFGSRHAEALAEIDRRLGLDYFSIDCGETPDGRLLVFECDTGGVVHAMDALDKFGYKRPHMLTLFAAFRALLLRAAADPQTLKPKCQPATLQ